MEIQNNEIEYTACMDRLSNLLYRARKLERQIHSAALELSYVCKDIYTKGKLIRISEKELKPYRNSISRMEEFYSSMGSIQKVNMIDNDNLSNQLETYIKRLASHKEKRYGEIIELLLSVYPSLDVGLDKTLHVDSELKSPDELKKCKTPKELREAIIRDIETALDTLIGAYKKVIRIFE